MIPKKIHYCWFGGNPLPELAQKCIASWRKFCPDYEIIEWNEKNIDVHSVEYMKECYEKQAWGFVPDVARLQIIFNNGGIYLDTDVEIVRSFDDLLNNKAFAGIQDGDENTIALGLGFGAEKKSEFIKILLDDYNERHFINNDGTLNRIPAPDLQKNLFRKIGFNGKNEKQIVMGATIYPTEYFCPKSCSTGVLEVKGETYSIHHYEGSWKSEDEHKYVEVKRKIMKKCGMKFGRVIWNGYRFFNRLAKKGLINTMHLLVKRSIRRK